MSRQVVHGVLAADVANGATFTVGYPTGYSRGAFSFAGGHALVIQGQVLTQPAGIGLSFGASSVTVTNRSGAALKEGSAFWFQFEEPGDDQVLVGGKAIYTHVPLVLLNLGSPAALVTNGVCESQNVGAAGPLTLNGSLVANGVAVLDVPRNLIVDSGGADDAVLTITGTDAYGAKLVETVTLNGTTAVSGKKAFKTVTGISASKAIANSAFVGTGDVLGLPVKLPAAGWVVRELEDGGTASSGTLVAGLARDTVSTATSADVRGTYDPNSACDGSKAIALLCALPDPEDRGQPQFVA